MRTVRFDPELDELVKRAAALEGVSVSEFLRRSAAERARLVVPTADRLRDVLGSVHGGGGQADRTGEAFTELLIDRERKRRLERRK